MMLKDLNIEKYFLLIVSFLFLVNCTQIKNKYSQYKEKDKLYNIEIYYQNQTLKWENVKHLKNEDYGVYEFSDNKGRTIYLDNPGLSVVTELSDFTCLEQKTTTGIKYSICP